MVSVSVSRILYSPRRQGKASMSTKYLPGIDSWGWKWNLTLACHATPSPTVPYGISFSLTACLLGKCMDARISTIDSCQPILGRGGADPFSLSLEERQVDERKDPRLSLN